MTQEQPEPTPVPDDVAVPEGGWPETPDADQPQEAEPEPVDPEVERVSNEKPEGWVEGEQQPGYTPEPIDPDDPAHPDNIGAPDPDRPDTP